MTPKRRICFRISSLDPGPRRRRQLAEFQRGFDFRAGRDLGACLQHDDRQADPGKRRVEPVFDRAAAVWRA